jgi:DNA-binding CsgD family transcriptional regulator
VGELDGSNVLLERERELARLDRLIDAAEAGHGGLLLVEGPAGIGKSELLAAVRRRAWARELVVLSARPSELDREFPFGVVRQLFAPVVAEPERGAALMRGAAALAGALLGVGAPQETPAGELAYFHSLYWVLANLADQSPVVLVLDDAHWADASSLRFLLFLASRIEELPVLLAFAARPREPGAASRLTEALAADRAATTVRPGVLSEQAVGKLIAATLGEMPAQRFTEACHDATGGNPFLLREALRELATDGVAPTAEHAGLVDGLAPATVSRAVLLRTARLGKDAVELARAVAVLGDEVPLRLAAELAGLSHDRVSELATQLTDAQILARTRPLAFAHPILRAAIYGDLGPTAAAAAHRRAAQLLSDQGAGADAVAVHLLESEPAGEPQVVTTLRTAAMAAAHKGSLHTAAACLRRALNEPPTPAERGPILLDLASAELHTGDPAELSAAVGHFDEGMRATTDPWARVAHLREQTLALGAIGRANEALAALERAVDELSAADPEAGLTAEALLVGMTWFDHSRLPWTRSRLERYGDCLSGETTGERMLLATRTLIDAHHGQRPADELADDAELALGAGRLLKDTGAEYPPFFYALAVLLLADRAITARRELDHAISLARRRGSIPGFAIASAWRAELLAREGKLTEAEADARSCAEVATAELFAASPATLGWVLDVLLTRGELNDADQLLAQSGLAEVELHENRTFDPVLHARARIRLARGDLKRARSDLSGQLRRGSRWNTLHTLQPSVLIAPELGNPDGADTEQMLIEARTWGTPRALGMALRAQALLTAGSRRLELLDEATKTLGSSPAQLEHARALVDLGAALRTGGQRTRAREHLRQALDLATACGAAPLAERARHELRAAGGRPRQPRTTGADALTASERRIATMARDGLSNAEIAQALVVTKKTVEAHLAGAYRKLAIHSRGQLRDTLQHT